MNRIELNILRAMLGIYIFMALLLAGLNYSYAQQAPENIAALINWLWHFYENWVKTILIALGGFLTLRILGGPSKNRLRKKNFRGFFAFALVVHIAGLLLFEYKGVKAGVMSDLLTRA